MTALNGDVGNLMDQAHAAVRRIASGHGAAHEPSDRPAAGAFHRFEVRRLADLVNDPDMNKPLPWLVPGLIPAGAAVLLYGSPKVGKTTLAAAICAAVAQGGTFLGRPISPAPVLYCDMERSRRLTVARLSEPFGDGDIPPTMMVASQRPTIPDLRSRIRDDGLRLVVLDSLVRLLTPESENDSAEMTDLLSPWVELAHTEDVTLTFIHHDRKGGGKHGAAARGSNSIVAAIDVAAHLEREAGETDNGRRRIQIVSNFDGLEPELRLSRDGATYTAALTPAQERQAKILDSLQNGDEVDVTHFEALLGQKRPTFLPDLNALVANGQIERQGTGKRGSPYLYRIHKSLSVTPTAPVCPDRNEDERGDAWEPAEGEP
jgi:hypothetical protein